MVAFTRLTSLGALMSTSSLMRAPDLALQLVLGRVVRCAPRNGLWTDWHRDNASDLPDSPHRKPSRQTTPDCGYFEAPSRPPMWYSKRRNANNGWRYYYRPRVVTWLRPRDAFVPYQSPRIPTTSGVGSPCAGSSAMARWHFRTVAAGGRLVFTEDRSPGWNTVSTKLQSSSSTSQTSRSGPRATSRSVVSAAGRPRHNSTQ